MAKKQKWFSPPVIEGDDERQRQASLLNVVTLSLAAVVILVMISSLVGRRPLTIAGSILFCFLLLFLLRHWLFLGKIEWTAAGVICLGMMTTTLTIAQMGTVQVPGSSFYLIIVMLAGLLFDVRGILITTLSSSLAIFVLNYAEHAGLLPPPIYSNTISVWINYSIYFCLTAYLAYYVLQSNKKVIQRANKELEYRQQINQALRSSQEKFTKAFISSPDSIILSGLADGRYLEVNESFLRDTGYTREEIIGFTSLERSIWATNEDRDRLVNELRTRGYARNVEAQYRRKSGELRDALISAEIIELEAGQKCLLAVVRDITENKRIQVELEVLNHTLEQRVDARTADLRQSEAALRASNDALLSVNMALEQVNRHKDEFLASMSHELRTPLTGILGLTEVLQLEVYGPINEKQLKALGNIENSGRHLLELINDILDLSKIEASKLELQLEDCQVSSICQSSLQLTRELAHRKNQKVFFSTNDPSAVIQADPLRLKQMLVNLLGNAIKFTPENGELGLEVNTDEDMQVIRFSVWDHGIGIEPGDMELLFKPFTQIDAKLARQHSGTGLGLWLVSRLADLHGGSVSVESAPGSGSRFTLQLPFQTGLPIPRLNEPLPALSTSSSTQAPVEILNSTGAVILVADDNMVNLEILSDYLLGQGYHVITTSSGEELVKLALELQPAAILTDIQMPGMDGLEAIRQIRTSGSAHLAHVPIFAVTALVMPGDQEKCLAAGADEYFSKPLSLARLAERLRVLAG